MTDTPKYPGFHNGLGKTSKGPHFHCSMCKKCKFFINSAYINCTPYPTGPVAVSHCDSYQEVKEGEAQGRQWTPPTHTVQEEPRNRIEIAGEYSTPQYTQHRVGMTNPGQIIDGGDDHGYADWPDEPDPWGHGYVDPCPWESYASDPLECIARARAAIYSNIGTYSSGCQIARTITKFRNNSDIAPALPPVLPPVDEHERAALLRHVTPLVMEPKHPGIFTRNNDVV